MADSPLLPTKKVSPFRLSSSSSASLFADANNAIAPLVAAAYNCLTEMSLYADNPTDTLPKVLKDLHTHLDSVFANVNDKSSNSDWLKSENGLSADLLEISQSAPKAVDFFPLLKNLDTSVWEKRLKLSHDSWKSLSFTTVIQVAFWREDYSLDEVKDGAKKVKMFKKSDFGNDPVQNIIFVFGILQAMYGMYTVNPDYVFMDEDASGKNIVLESNLSLLGDAVSRNASDKYQDFIFQVFRFFNKNAELALGMSYGAVTNKTGVSFVASYAPVFSKKKLSKNAERPYARQCPTVKLLAEPNPKMTVSDVLPLHTEVSNAFNSATGESRLLENALNASYFLNANMFSYVIDNVSNVPVSNGVLLDFYTGVDNPTVGSELLNDYPVSDIHAPHLGLQRGQPNRVTTFRTRVSDLPMDIAFKSFINGLCGDLRKLRNVPPETIFAFNDRIVEMYESFHIPRVKRAIDLLVNDLDAVKADKEGKDPVAELAVSVYKATVMKFPNKHQRNAEDVLLKAMSYLQTFGAHLPLGNSENEMNLHTWTPKAEPESMKVNAPSDYYIGLEPRNLKPRKSYSRGIQKVDSSVFARAGLHFEQYAKNAYDKSWSSLMESYKSIVESDTDTSLAPFSTAHRFAEKAREFEKKFDEDENVPPSYESFLMYPFFMLSKLFSRRVVPSTPAQALVAAYPAAVENEVAGVKSYKRPLFDKFMEATPHPWIDIHSLCDTAPAIEGSQHTLDVLKLNGRFKLVFRYANGTDTNNELSRAIHATDSDQSLYKILSQTKSVQDAVDVDRLASKLKAKRCVVSAATLRLLLPIYFNLKKLHYVHDPENNLEERKHKNNFLKQHDVTRQHGFSFSISKETTELYAKFVSDEYLNDIIQLVDALVPAYDGVNDLMAFGNYLSLVRGQFEVIYQQRVPKEAAYMMTQTPMEFDHNLHVDEFGYESASGEAIGGYPHLALDTLSALYRPLITLAANPLFELPKAVTCRPSATNPRFLYKVIEKREAMGFREVKPKTNEYGVFTDIKSRMCFAPDLSRTQMAANLAYVGNLKDRRNKLYLLLSSDATHFPVPTNDYEQDANLKTLRELNYVAVDSMTEGSNAEVKARRNQIEQWLSELQSIERMMRNSNNAPMLIDFDLGARITVDPIKQSRTGSSEVFNVENLTTSGKLPDTTIAFLLNPKSQVFRTAASNKKEGDDDDTPTESCLPHLYATAASYRELLVREGMAETNTLDPEYLIKHVLERRNKGVDYHQIPEVAFEFVDSFTRGLDLEHWPLAHKTVSDWKEVKAGVFSNISKMSAQEKESLNGLIPDWNELLNSMLVEYYVDDTLPLPVSTIIEKLANDPFYSQYFRTVSYWAKKVQEYAQKLVQSQAEGSARVTTSIENWMGALTGSVGSSRDDLLTRLQKASDDVEEGKWSPYGNREDYDKFLDNTSSPVENLASMSTDQYKRASNFFLFELWIALQEFTMLDAKSPDSVLMRPLMPPSKLEITPRVLASSDDETTILEIETESGIEWSEYTDEQKKEALLEYAKRKATESDLELYVKVVDRHSMVGGRTVKTGEYFAVYSRAYQKQSVPTFKMIESEFATAFNTMLPAFATGANALSKVVTGLDEKQAERGRSMGERLAVLNTEMAIPYANGALMHHQLNALLRRNTTSDGRIDLGEYHSIRVTMLHVEPGGGKTITGTVAMLMAAHQEEVREYFKKLYNADNTPREMESEERAQLILECPYRPLVVSPKNLIRNWIADAQKVTGATGYEDERLNVYPLDTEVLNSRPLDMIRAEVMNARPNTLFVTSYSAISNPSAKTDLVIGTTPIATSMNVALFKSLGFTHVFLDEGHAIKNGDLDNGSFVREAMTDVLQCDTVREITIATGSPATNRVSDFIGLIKAVSPSMAGDYPQIGHYTEHMPNNKPASTKDDFAKGFNKTSADRLRSLAYSVFDYNFVPQGEWAYALPKVRFRNFLITRFANSETGLAWLTRPDALTNNSKENLLHLMEMHTTNNQERAEYATNTGEYSYKAAVEFMLKRGYYDRFKDLNITTVQDVLYQDLLLMQSYRSQLDAIIAASNAVAVAQSTTVSTEDTGEGEDLVAQQHAIPENFLHIMQFFNDAQNDPHGRAEVSRDVVSGGRSFTLTLPALKLPNPRATYLYYLLLRHFKDYYEAENKAAENPNFIDFPRTAGRKILITAQFRRTLNNFFENAPDEIKRHSQIIMGVGDIEFGENDTMKLQHVSTPAEHKVRMTAFEQREDMMFLWATTKLVGTGFNLQMGNRILSLDTQVTPGEFQQLMSRVRRPDVQNKYGRSEVFFDRILVDGSFDITMLSVFSSKYIDLVRTNNSLYNPELFASLDSPLPQLRLNARMFTKADTWKTASEIELSNKQQELNGVEYAKEYDGDVYAHINNGASGFSKPQNYLAALHRVYAAEDADSDKRLSAQVELSNEAGKDRLKDALEEYNGDEKAYLTALVKKHLQNDTEHPMWAYTLPYAHNDFCALLTDTKGRPIEKDSPEYEEYIDPHGNVMQRKLSDILPKDSPQWKSWPVVQPDGSIVWKTLATRPNLFIPLERSEPLHGTQPALFTPPVSGEVSRIAEKFGFELEVLSKMLSLYSDFSRDDLIEYGWPVLTQFGFGRVVSIGETVCSVLLPNGEVVSGLQTNTVALVSGVTKENEYLLGMMVDSEQYNLDVDAAKAAGRPITSELSYVCYRQYKNTKRLSFRNASGDFVTPESVVVKHPVSYDNETKSYKPDYERGVELVELGRKFNAATRSYINGTGVFDSYYFTFEPIASSSRAGYKIPPFARTNRTNISFPTRAEGGNYFSVRYPKLDRSGNPVLVDGVTQVTTHYFEMLSYIGAFSGRYAWENPAKNSSTVDLLIKVREVDPYGNPKNRSGSEMISYIPYARTGHANEVTVGGVTYANLVSHVGSILEKGGKIEWAANERWYALGELTEARVNLILFGEGYVSGAAGNLKAFSSSTNQFLVESLRILGIRDVSDFMVATAKLVSKHYAENQRLLRTELVSTSRQADAKIRKFNDLVLRSTDSSAIYVALEENKSGNKAGVLVESNNHVLFVPLFSDDVAASNVKSCAAFVSGLDPEKSKTILSHVDKLLAEAPKDLVSNLYLLGTGKATPDSEVDLHNALDLISATAEVVTLPKFAAARVKPIGFDGEVLNPLYNEEELVAAKKRKADIITRNVIWDDTVSFDTSVAPNVPTRITPTKDTKPKKPVSVPEAVPVTRNQPAPTGGTPPVTRGRPAPTPNDAVRRERPAPADVTPTPPVTRGRPVPTDVTPPATRGRPAPTDVTPTPPTTPTPQVENVLARWRLFYPGMLPTQSRESMLSQLNREYTPLFFPKLCGAGANGYSTSCGIILAGVGSTFNKATGVYDTKPLSKQTAANLMYKFGSENEAKVHNRFILGHGEASGSFYGSVFRIAIPNLNVLKKIYKLLPTKSPENSLWSFGYGHVFSRQHIADLTENEFTNFVSLSSLSKTTAKVVTNPVTPHAVAAEASLEPVFFEGKLQRMLVFTFVSTSGESLRNGIIKLGFSQYDTQTQHRLVQCYENVVCYYQMVVSQGDNSIVGALMKDAKAAVSSVRSILTKT